MSDMEDGPLFRATLEDLEIKESILKQEFKKILKLGNSFLENSYKTLKSSQELINALGEVTVDRNLQSLLKETQEIISIGQEKFLQQFQTLVVNHLSNLYDTKLKPFDVQKKDFHQAMQDYYSYQSKYLAKSDEKAKKNGKIDAKFNYKTKSFELKKFDYILLLKQITGSEMELQISFALTNFLKKRFSLYQDLNSKFIEKRVMLESLAKEGAENTKVIYSQKKEFEERRKILEQLKSESNMEFYEDSPLSGAFPDIPPGPGDGPLSEGGTTTTVRSRLRKKEGFLLVTIPNPSITHFQGWKKVWCVVSNDNLHEYADWKKKMENYQIFPLKLTTVKEAKYSDRRFCFEIISPNFGRRIYQAMGDEDMRAWILVIQAAIENQLIGQIPKDDSQDDVSSVISIQQIFKNADLGNTVCADCAESDPEWSSINLGILLCIECSGVHRGLGTHISKVRSLTLDVSSWTDELIEVVQGIGNTVSNSIWDCPNSQSLRKSLGKAMYIREKYANKAYVNFKEIVDPYSHLKDAIYKMNLVEALKAVALGVGLNDVEYYPRPLLFQVLGYPAISLDMVSGNTHFEATNHARLVMAEFLIQNGILIDSVDMQQVEIEGEKIGGMTPLLHAVMLNDWEGIHYLVKKGADVTTTVFYLF